MSVFSVLPLPFGFYISLLVPWWILYTIFFLVSQRSQHAFLRSLFSFLPRVSVYFWVTLFQRRALGGVQIGNLRAFSDGVFGRSADYLVDGFGLGGLADIPFRKVSLRHVRGQAREKKKTGLID